jgi:hypothetical protein
VSTLTDCFFFSGTLRTLILPRVARSASSIPGSASAATGSLLLREARDTSLTRGPSSASNSLQPTLTTSSGSVGIDSSNFNTDNNC